MNDEFSTDYSAIADLNGNHENNLDFKDSESIKVHQENGTYSFNVRNCEESNLVSSNAYYGPFAVTKEVDENENETLILCGYNPDKNRYFNNFIDIGLESALDVPEQEIDLSENGWVYLEIAYDSNYTVEIKNDAEFPAQTDTELYIRIAYVTFKDDKISEIIQYQYGGINLPGRIF